MSSQPAGHQVVRRRERRLIEDVDVQVHPIGVRAGGVRGGAPDRARPGGADRVGVGERQPRDVRGIRVSVPERLFQVARTDEPHALGVGGRPGGVAPTPPARARAPRRSACRRPRRSARSCRRTDRDGRRGTRDRPGRPAVRRRARRATTNNSRPSRRGSGGLGGGPPPHPPLRASRRGRRRSRSPRTPDRARRRGSDRRDRRRRSHATGRRRASARGTPRAHVRSRRTVRPNRWAHRGT